MTLLLALPAQANTTGSRLAVVGFGQCDDALLQSATREVRGAVSRQAGSRVLDEDATAAPSGGMRRGSLEEVGRQVETARRELLALNTGLAHGLFVEALAAVERLPLGPQRWELWLTARVNFARLHQVAGRDDDAVRQFLEILSVKEDFELNRSEFPPSTRELLERTRVLLKAQPRHVLTVTSRPSGATVYLNGYATGRTPLKQELPAGTYRVTVGEDNGFSFLRPVAMSADRSLEVDLLFEGRLRPDQGPCLELDPAVSADAGREARLALASMLATALNVDQVVAVRLTREGDSGGERYVAAALVERSGREIREGRDQLAGTRLPPVNQLAAYVLTGERLSAGLFDGSDPQGSGSRKWTRVAAWSLAGAAVLLGGAAIYSHVRLGSMQTELESLVVPDSGGAIRAEDSARANGLRAGIDSASLQRGLFAAGAGAALVGSGVFFGLTYLGGDGADSGAGGGMLVTVGGSF